MQHSPLDHAGWLPPLLCRRRFPFNSQCRLMIRKFAHAKRQKSPECHLRDPIGREIAPHVSAGTDLAWLNHFHSMLRSSEGKKVFSQRKCWLCHFCHCFLADRWNAQRQREDPVESHHCPQWWWLWDKENQESKTSVLHRMMFRGSCGYWSCTIQAIYWTYINILHFIWQTLSKVTYIALYRTTHFIWVCLLTSGFNKKHYIFTCPTDPPQK